MIEVSKTKLQREDYQVCWICPLPVEITAAEAMLDERHAPIPNNPHDSNVYTLGRMGVHNIAIAGLPAGNPVATAIAATHMKHAFPAMRVVLLVGIGGGVPSPKNDIRLGDIVVSYPDGIYGGVVQVDRGKTVPTSVNGDGFEIRGSLNQPPDQLLNVVNTLKSKHTILDESEEPEFMKYLTKATQGTPRLRAQYPGKDQDHLFKSCYDHEPTESTCKDCDVRRTIHREPRNNNEPRIHFGLIASANNVRKDGRTRETLRQKLDILCFEMEAAGIMNNFACLVIRGISDYADSHKNDQWQPYAACAAAAYTKEALTLLPEIEVSGWKTVKRHDKGEYR
jgi:nucleoside phosphorylase